MLLTALFGEFYSSHAHEKIRSQFNVVGKKWYLYSLDDYSNSTYYYIVCAMYSYFFQLLFEKVVHLVLPHNVSSTSVSQNEV